MQHCFLPQGLDRCNGRGIGNKLTLDPVKMEKTRKHNKNSRDVTVKDIDSYFCYKKMSDQGHSN